MMVGKTDHAAYSSWTGHLKASNLCTVEKLYHLSKNALKNKQLSL